MAFDILRLCESKQLPCEKMDILIEKSPGNLGSVWAQLIFGLQE